MRNRPIWAHGPRARRLSLLTTIIIIIIIVSSLSYPHYRILIILSTSQLVYPPPAAFGSGSGRTDLSPAVRPLWLRVGVLHGSHCAPVLHCGVSTGTGGQDYSDGGSEARRLGQGRACVFGRRNPHTCGDVIPHHIIPYHTTSYHAMPCHAMPTLLTLIRIKHRRLHAPARKAAPCADAEGGTAKRRHAYVGLRACMRRDFDRCSRPACWCALIFNIGHGRPGFWTSHGTICHIPFTTYHLPYTIYHILYTVYRIRCIRCVPSTGG